MRSWSLLLQMGPDCFKHGVWTRQHIVVPDAQNAKALPGKPAIALSIASAIGVLAAVEFDDQLLVRTENVDDVAPDGDLAAKFVGGETAAAHEQPQPALGFGGSGSRAPGEAAQARGRCGAPFGARALGGHIAFGD